MYTGLGGSTLDLEGSVNWESALGHTVKNARGYLRITSGPLRGKYLHRAVWEFIAKQQLPEGWQVHHMRGKEHSCPESLIASPACLHVGAEPLRDPSTGEFISVEAWERRYGERPRT